MTHRSTDPPRRARSRRAALALAGAAGALLVFAGTAGATTFRPTDTASFVASLNSANSNGPGHDTIVLPSDVTPSPNAVLIINTNLTITGDHADQFSPDGPGLDGTNVSPIDADFITVNAGVTVRMAGINVVFSSQAPFSTIKANASSNLILENVSVLGNNGRGLEVIAGATVTATNTSIQDNQTIGIVNGGTLTLTNSNVVANTGGGIVNSGSLHLRNTIVFGNTGADCFQPATSSIASRQGNAGTGGGGCGAATPFADPDLRFSDFNGGPTPTQRPQTGSPVINAGDPAFCPTTDQRFYVRPHGQCDIGAYEVGPVPFGGPFETGENDGLRDTTPPTCVVTALRTGGPIEQDVTVRDGGSGIGNDGVRIDLVSPPVSSTYTSPDESFISNGTISVPALPSPFRSPVGSPPPANNGLVVTATKTTVGTPTQWSFLARDWAGNVRTCI